MVTVSLPDRNDETPVPLTPDAESVALKALVETMDVLRQIHTDVRTRTVKAGMRTTLCGLLEYQLAHLFKAVGYDGALAAEVAGRNQAVREANAEIRRLEQLVGSSRGFDGVPELLSAMSREMRDFWKSQGFSLVYDSPGSPRGEGGGFSASGGCLLYRATLSLGLDWIARMDSATPVTDQLTEAGFIEQMGQRFDLGQEPSWSRDWYLLDTERNRATVRGVLKERFPSLMVVSWNSRHFGRDDQRFTLWGCDILLRDCSELLPRPATSA